MDEAFEEEEGSQLMDEEIDSPGSKKLKKRKTREFKREKKDKKRKSKTETEESALQFLEEDDDDDANDSHEISDILPITKLSEKEPDHDEKAKTNKKGKRKRSLVVEETQDPLNMDSNLTFEEICTHYQLQPIQNLQYVDSDFRNLSTYRAFTAHVRPLIQKENPRVPVAKLVPLVAAMWREFVAINPYKEQERLTMRSKDREGAVDVPQEEKAEQTESDEQEAGAGGQSSKRRIVAPLKIKLTQKKKQRKRRGAGGGGSDDEELVEGAYNTSDEEFERQLEEAALLEENDKTQPPPKKPKVVKKSKPKLVKKKILRQENPDKDGYETDHQDYCEVCQQGGEVILCDTCPRAYHLVCFDPELESAPEGRWSCPHCEENGFQEKEEVHADFCYVCKEGGKITGCDTCSNAYHLQCLKPPILEIPIGRWTCPRCSCEPIMGRVQKILTWRWKEPPKIIDELDHVTPHHYEEKKLDHRDKEFFIKWHGMSYWHCIWITELQLDVHHPIMYRNYTRKNDMDEPPPLEDGSTYGREDKEPKEDKNNLEQRFYRYGVRPEWLQIHRILNHRQHKDEPVYYLIKWRDLSYDQAIWEKEDSPIPDLQKFIDEYFELRSIMLGEDQQAKKKKVPTATLR